MKYVHPTKGDYIYIRVMPGKPHSPFPHQQKPYVVHLQDGKYLDQFGNPVVAGAIEAHIPLDVFLRKNSL